MGAGIRLEYWLGNGIHALRREFSESKTIQNGNRIAVEAK